ncbi:MAG: hypothetical protein MJ016_00120 [Victivallaceae bacterium]|nr:hypothetical protein [Victivallaceae bacterium]
MKKSEDHLSRDPDVLFTRMHPDYARRRDVWKKSRDAYSGGSGYLEAALIRHVSEIELEFSERRRRAYYFNYPRSIARQITQSVLGTEPVRRNADAELVEDWSRSGLRATGVMRQLSTMLSVYGKAYLLVESPRFEGEVSLRRAAEERLRPYVRTLSALDVTDWAYGADGKLLWALISEEAVDHSDPFSSEVRRERMRLLERDRWRVFERTASGCREVGGGVNPIGEVPLVSVEEIDGFGMDANHWFEDVVRISEAILNNESESQMNIVKQMFGMLVVSDSFARGARKLAAGNSAAGFAATVARSAAIIESVEEKGISRYIGPSGVASEVIRQENLQLKQELYDVVGLAVQGRGRENRTAESKEWDFRHVDWFLAERAAQLEEAEISAWKMIHRFDRGIPVPEIAYNREFAVRDLQKTISGLLQLSQLSGDAAYRRAVRNAAVELLGGVAAMPSGEKEELASPGENQGEKK